MKCFQKFLIVLACLGYFCAPAAAWEDDLIVSLPNGKVQGLQLQTNDSKIFYAFKGMQYGQPPVGKMRFQAPVASGPWKGIWNATKEGAGCIPLVEQSFYPNPANLSEDCLYLNVYTPTLNKSSKLAVMFWIFGGGFNGGLGDQKYYGPEYLIEHDVVIVTINHRLGPLGLLSTGDNVILGNACLKDQVLALKWVQNNILYFGGDPEKVTIFGESSGGQSVGLQILSKQSKGLFRGVICQSGCSITNGLNANPRELIYKVANLIDSSISDKNSSEEIRDFLINQTTDALVKASSVIGQAAFRPTIEAKDENAFIDRPYYNILSEGDINNVSLIVGFTSLEGLRFVNEKVLNTTSKGFDDNITTLVPKNLFYKEGSNLTEIATIIKNAYVGENGSFAEQPEKTLEYSSDNINVKAAYKAAQIGSKFMSAVYIYQFSFYGSVSKLHYILPEGGKVGHFDDVPYLWNMPLYPIVTDADRLTVKRFTKLWTNFAKYLNPTPEPDSLLQNVTWEQVTPTNLHFLDIGDNLTLTPNHKVKENAAWDQVFYNYSDLIITF